MDSPLPLQWRIIKEARSRLALYIYIYEVFVLAKRERGLLKESFKLPVRWMADTRNGPFLRSVYNKELFSEASLSSLEQTKTKMYKD